MYNVSRGLYSIKEFYNSMKKCKKCKKNKKLIDFHKKHTSKDGLDTICKICKSKSNKIRNKLKNNKVQKTEKFCLKCLVYKKSFEFSKDKYSSDGLSGNCKKCRNKYKQIYRKKTNRESDKKYQQNKYDNDIQYRILTNIRNRINGAIRNKSNSTIEYLGCTIENYIIYLESKFLPGMNWNNKHLWHIDHIIPCSSFDLTNNEDCFKCFNYQNTQPLWASDNLKKSNH